MKRGFKRGLSLLVVTMMLTSMVPVSVMAAEITAGNKVVAQPENQAMLQEETTMVYDSAAQPESSAVNSTTPVNSTPNVKNDNMVKEEPVVKTEITMIDGQRVVQMSPEMEQREGTINSLQTSVTSGDYEYVDINDGISITKYIGNGGDVVIPAKLANKTVLEIGYNAFYLCDSITSIIIPEGVTDIGSRAFYSCQNLSNVTFPRSLRNIGDGAFGGCNSIINIDIPEGVTSIGISAFNACYNLTSISLSKSVINIGYLAFGNCHKLMTIIIPGENPNYKIINGMLFDKPGETLVACPGGKTSADIPESVTSIGNCAFFGCVNLTNISLSERVTSIGDRVFSNCYKLTGISVSGTNSNYTSINGILFNKSETTLIACPGGKTSVSIPTSVTSIGDSSFWGCFDLSIIDLPESVTNIGEYVFMGCDKLTSIEIPEGVPSIGNQTLSYCYKLSRVVLPESVTSIDSSAFLSSALVNIYGVPNSYAETYANENNIPFVDSSKPFLGIESFTADKGSGQSVDTSIRLIAKGANGTLPYQYRFYYHLGNQTVTIQDYSSSDTSTFKPTDAGTYTLQVDVKDADGKTATGNIDGYSIVGNLTNPTNPIVISFTTDKASGQGVNTSIQLTAEGSGGTTPYQYKFYYKQGTKITSIRNFSGSSTVTFKPTKAGSYILWVEVKDATGKIGSASIADYTVVADPSVKTFTTDKASGQATNTDINLTATGADGKTPYEYKFSYKLGTKTFSIQDFSAMNTATFKPTASGTYTLIVDIKDANGKVSSKSITSYKVVNSLGVKSFITDKISGQGVDTNIKLTATGSDGKTPYQYQFGYTLGADTIILRDYATTNTTNFKPAQVGNYTLFVTVKDANGNTATKNIDSYGIVPNPSVSSFTTDKASGQGINTSIQLSATGVDGKTPYQYKFYYKLGTSTVTIKNFASANTATFKPTKAGTYTLWVDIKDATGKIGSASIADYTVIGDPSVKTFTTDKASDQTTNTDINLTATGADEKTPYEYKFSYKLGTKTFSIQDFSATNTATFKPTASGTYTLIVDVKDANGKVSSKSITSYKVVNSLGVKSFTTDKISGQGVDAIIKLTATGSDGKAPYQYQFGYKLGSETGIIKDYSATNTATFTPPQVGAYTLFVTIKDANGKTVAKNIDNYSVVPNPSVSSFTTDKASGQGINTSIQLKAEGADGRTPYQYKFYYKLGTKTVTLKNFSTANIATFKPTKVGDYTLYVDLKDANGKTSTRSIKVYQVAANPAAVVHPTSVSLDKITDTLIVGYDVTLSATVLPANASNKAVTWTSSDTNIAVVDDSGNVTGVCAGITTIIATTADGSQEASCEITVNQDEQFQSVEYQSFIQNYGWMDPVSNWEMTGTTGMRLRMEAIKINLLNAPEGSQINYEVYDDKTGWQGLLSDGEMAGSTGLGKHMEAIKITLQDMPGYSVEYQVSVTGLGWMSHVADGEMAGTMDCDLPIEAICIRIVRN